MSSDLTETPHSSAARMRALIEGQSDCMLVLDLDGVVLFANAAAQAVFRRPVADLVGIDLGLPVCRTGASEIELLRPGEQRHPVVEMHLYPTLWDGATAWIATLRDISERKRAETMQHLLAAIVDSSDDAIVGKNLAGIITSWNAGAEKVFGYSAAQAIGRSMLILFPPERVHEEADILARIARGERVRDFETERIRQDGRRIHVALSISPIIDEDGLVVGASKIARDISDRHATREQLARNVALLRIASRAARLGGWSIALPSRHLLWSDEIREMHQVPPDFNPSLEDGIAFYPPEYRDEVVQHVEACIRDGTPFDFKSRILTAKGRRLSVRAMGEVVRDDRGTIIGLQGAFQDISEQEAVAGKIRSLGTRLVDTLENITDAFFTVDHDWCFNYVNAEAERLLEHDRDAVLGRNLWEVFPDAIGTRFERNYRRAVDDMVTVAFEEFYPQLGKWFEVRAYPSPDGLAVYFRDVTELRHNQEALRASEERFRLLSQATNDAIWDWDLAANTLWWNEGFETLFGYNRSDMEPGIEAWSSRIHPEDRERVVGEVMRSMEGSTDRWSGGYRFRRRDGSYAQVLDRGLVVRDTAGRVVRRVGGMTDVTERTALEERLRQSQRLESVGQLTGGVAHDFNNLLTVILGNAELLATQLGGDSSQRALAEMILGAANRGAELTQRLLAFARKQALDPKVVDVNLQVAELDQLLRRALGEHIEIEFVRGADLWSALVDPAQLENALLNLSLNARDAMPRGGRLTIESANAGIDASYAASHSELSSGDYVMLAVSDTGTGIAPEDLARVFEPFYTTKAKGKGTGLGLAMVWGFVKQSGGHATVYSEPGHGTTIKLYLPRANAPTPNAALRVPEGPVVGGNETILMVEDDAFVRRYAQNQLQTLGYTVLTADNGHQALAVLRQHREIDLLFTDVVMPGMSGRELADQARALRPGLRVLYTSGYTENAIVHHGRLDPGVMLLGKPYRRADMARKVREALTQK